METVKSEIENDIIEKSAKALSNNTSFSSKTVSEIAKESFMSKGFLDELKSGKKRINIVHLVKIAKALGKYPSELLPTEWQKPSTSEINPEILAQATQEILEAAAKLDFSLPEEKKYKLISDLYCKKIREHNNLQAKVTLLHKEVDK